MELKKTLRPYACGLFFLVGFFTTQAQDNRNIALKNYLAQIENQFDVRFSFLEAAVEGITLPYTTFDSLQDSLQYLEGITGLTIEYLEANKYAIVKKKTLNLCGYVLDNFGENSIPGASVEVLGSSTAVLTSEEGRFELNDVERSATIKIRYLGFVTQYVPATSFARSDCKRVLLAEQREVLAEVVVYDLLTSGIQQQTDGRISIDTQNLGTLPGLSEPDILLGIQALPGIKSIDETVSDINIRGGTNDQNLLLWNDIRLFQSGHFFGLISAINPFLIKEVDIYKNGTPSAFGEGVSGLIKVSTGDQMPVTMKGGAGANLVSADFFIETPVGDDFGVQFSARRSFTDLIKTPAYGSFTDRAFQDTQVNNLQSGQQVEGNTLDEDFFFYDASGKLFYDWNTKHRFRLSGLYTKNGLGFISENTTQNTRETGVLNQESLALGYQSFHQWSTRFSSKFVGYYSLYNLYAQNDRSSQLQTIRQRNRIDETSFKMDSKWNFADQWIWSLGYQFTETGVNNLTQVTLPTFLRNIKDVLRVHSPFAQIKYNADDDLMIGVLGFRVNHFQNLSTFQNITYEPRLSLNFKIANHLRAQVLGEMKSQGLSQVIDLEDNFLGLEKRRWFIAEEDLLPLNTSLQYSIGVNTDKDGFFLGVEGFVKKVQGISTLTQGFQNQGQIDALTGFYRVTGLELLTNLKYDKLKTWLSYAFNANTYSFENYIPAEFPSNFDITHTLTLAGTYEWEILNLGVGMNYRTGRPYTKPNQSDPLNVNSFPIEINYQSINSSRLPDYFRIDMTLGYEYNINRFSRINVALSVLNLTARKNILNTYYRVNEQGELEEVINRSLSFTPNFSLRWFF